MRKEECVTQVNDDSELLELMMEDTRSAPDLYKPTNYWLNYEKRFLPELRSLGLRDFRRRKNSILYSFGATDLLPKSQRIDKPVSKIIRAMLRVRKIENLCKIIQRTISGVDLKDLRLLYYELAKLYGEKKGAKSIRELEASLVGNPEDVFFVDGRLYTRSLFSYYCQYAYCCKYVDFDSVDSIMEIGSGSGKQIEVIKRLHPNICFYVFEISPQLYVCEQYLSALFPDSVISYRQTRKMKIVPKQHEGKIFIFGDWKLPELADLNYTLFWNSASFQEMEPDVVLNYLKYVNRQAKKHVFLAELMEGKNLANKKGEHGVLEKTTLEHYKKGLSNFQLRDLSRAILPLYASREPYIFSFWSRKGN